MHEYERAWKHAESYARLRGMLAKESAKREPDFQGLGKRLINGEIDLPELDPDGAFSLVQAAGIAHKAKKEFGDRPELLYQALTGVKLDRKDIEINPTTFGLSFSTGHGQEYYRTVSPHFSELHLQVTGLPLGLSGLTPMKDGEMDAAQKEERDRLRKTVAERTGRGISDLLHLSTIQMRQRGARSTALHEERHTISKLLGRKLTRIGTVTLADTPNLEELWADWGIENPVALLWQHRNLPPLHLLKIKYLQLRHRIPNEQVAALIRTQDRARDVLKVMEHNLDRREEGRHDHAELEGNESKYGRWRPEPTRGTKGKGRRKAS